MIQKMGREKDTLISFLTRGGGQAGQASAELFMTKVCQNSKSPKFDSQTIVLDLAFLGDLSPLSGPTENIRPWFLSRVSISSLEGGMMI